ncbi:MAG TPA: sialidase family protein [Archangium sp.]
MTQELGLPPGAIDFFDPVLTVDRRGTLHALWGDHDAGYERDTGSATSNRSGEQYVLERVLHARYRDGHWTPAEVVYRGAGVSWLRTMVSRLEEDAAGNLQVAFVARRGSGSNVLVHMRLGPEGWRKTEWDGDRIRRTALNPAPQSVVAAIGGLYPSLAVGPGKRIYLAFASAARIATGGRTPGGDTNSLWVRRSDDGGMTWSVPMLAHRAGPMGAYEPKIVAAGHDTVHLLWQKQLDQRPGEDEIWHSISTDGGVTWGSPARVRPPGSQPLRNLQVVGTARGELYMAFAHQPAAAEQYADRRRGPVHEQIYYARWRGSRWSAPRLLRPEVGVLPFDLRIDRAGRLHLLWAYMAASGSGGQMERRIQSYAVASPCAP